MGYSYASFQTALASEMVVPNNNTLDANFQLILPTIIDYAEQRCYRDLDLLFATNSDTATFTPSNRKLDLSELVPYLIIVEEMNVITPSTVTDPELGTRNQLVPVEKPWLDAVFNSATGAAVPQYFAMYDDITALVGPWPDKAYTVEVVGKYRPLPLYDPRCLSGTFLSLYLPDLFLAAAMVAASGYRHNFGAQADEPRMAVAWESQYQTLMGSALKEEARKKFLGFEQMTSRQTPVPNA